MPEEFGRYELHDLLGRGGMGEVYRAFDRVRDRTVALKLLPKHLASDESFKARFRRESTMAARLNEPHIIPIHDFGEIDGTLFIDMRLVEGSDLGYGARRPRPVADRHRGQRRVAGGGGTRRRARERAGAPRRQTVQRPAHRHDRGGGRESLRLPGGFRYRPFLDAGRHRAHRDDRDHRHGRVHVTRAHRRRARRPAHRHLCPGLRALRNAHRPQAVRRRALRDHVRARQHACRPRCPRSWPTCRTAWTSWCERAWPRIPPSATPSAGALAMATRDALRAARRPLAQPAPPPQPPPPPNGSRPAPRRSVRRPRHASAPKPPLPPHPSGPFPPAAPVRAVPAAPHPSGPCLPGRRTRPGPFPPPQQTGRPRRLLRRAAAAHDPPRGAIGSSPPSRSSWWPPPSSRSSSACTAAARRRPARTRPRRPARPPRR